MKPGFQTFLPDGLLQATEFFQNNFDGYFGDGAIPLEQHFGGVFREKAGEGLVAVEGVEAAQQNHRGTRKGVGEMGGAAVDADEAGGLADDLGQFEDGQAATEVDDGRVHGGDGWFQADFDKLQ